MVNTCLGYAARLSPYEHKGVTGLPETEDSERALKRKLKRLVALVKDASKVVALTGAGISTSAGIPDFRGEKGIWTLEKKKRKRRRDDDIEGASFETAQPTTTHRALVALAANGKLTWCATQNVDGLHLTSGFPRSKLAILHGCVFTERCEPCDKEFVRSFDVGGISFQPTGRQCDVCTSDLVDTILDWDDDLPDREWNPTSDAFDDADVALCLGTSLRITPAADLPLKAKAFVIINLQQTPHDSQATLVIRARVDRVMTHLLNELNIPLLPEEIPASSGDTVAAAAAPRTT